MCRQVRGCSRTGNRNEQPFSDGWIQPSWFLPVSHRPQFVHDLLQSLLTSLVVAHGHCPVSGLFEVRPIELLDFGYFPSQLLDPLLDASFHGPGMTPSLFLLFIEVADSRPPSASRLRTRLAARAKARVLPGPTCRGWRFENRGRRAMAGVLRCCSGLAHWFGLQ